VGDIFDEVAEDLRTERALKLARRYGGWLLAACLAVLLGVAGQQVYIWYQAKQNQEAAGAYITISGPIEAAAGTLSAADAVKDASALTNFAATAPEGYKTIANLRAAALYVDAGQPAQAQALWDGVANDSSAEPLLRDLATLLWCESATGSAPDATVLARLHPLTADGNPYHGLAREDQALIYLAQGQTGLAKALLTELAADPDAPDGVRNRADGLLTKLNG